MVTASYSPWEHPPVITNLTVSPITSFTPDVITEAFSFLSRFKIIENPYLFKDGKPYTVKRTWKERLFSKPWKPLQKFKIIIPKIPDDNIFVLNGATLVGHPETIRALKEKLSTISKK